MAPPGSDGAAPEVQGPVIFSCPADPERGLLRERFQAVHYDYARNWEP